MHSNTNTPEDIINQMSLQYRMSPYLKLRGHVAYRTAKLAGQYLAKAARLLNEAEEFDDFTVALESVRSDQFSDQIAEMMGLNGSPDMLETIQTMVGYANKLNFDLQDIVDPTESMRENPQTAKAIGVYFTEDQQRASWLSSIRMVAESEKEIEPFESYDEYKTKVDDKKFLLTEDEYKDQCTSSTPLHETYEAEILDFIMAFGQGENDFDMLPKRAQITVIESMRSKIPSMRESALKSAKYARGTKVEKVLEASAVKGLVNSFDQQFIDMLDSSRYAGLEEFMWNHVPKRSDKKPSAVVTRRIIAKQEDKLVAQERNKKMSDNQLAAYEKQLAAEGLSALDDI